MKVAGIKLEKYSNGSIKRVIFDYKKHSNIVEPLLQQTGVLSEDDDFEKKWKDGYTTEEARIELKKRIRKWFK